MHLSVLYLPRVLPTCVGDLRAIFIARIHWRTQQPSYNISFPPFLSTLQPFHKHERSRPFSKQGTLIAPGIPSALPPLASTMAIGNFLAPPCLQGESLWNPDIDLLFEDRPKRGIFQTTSTPVSRCRRRAHRAAIDGTTAKRTNERDGGRFYELIRDGRGPSLAASRR